MKKWVKDKKIDDDETQTELLPGIPGLQLLQPVKLKACIQKIDSNSDAAGSADPGCDVSLRHEHG